MIFVTCHKLWRIKCPRNFRPPLWMSPFTTFFLLVHIAVRPSDALGLKARVNQKSEFSPGCPQYLLDIFQKVQNAAARLVCKAKKSDHIHPILELCIGNFNYLLQFHLWNSPSLSVRSPSTVCSSKTVTICI